MIDHDPLCEEPDPECSCAEKQVERLRSRVAELEAAIRAHRGEFAYRSPLAPPSDIDAKLYAMLREEVKG